MQRSLSPEEISLDLQIQERVLDSLKSGETLTALATGTGSVKSMGLVLTGLSDTNLLSGLFFSGLC